MMVWIVLALVLLVGVLVTLSLRGRRPSEEGPRSEEAAAAERTAAPLAEQPADVHAAAMRQIGNNPQTQVEKTIHTANYLIYHLMNGNPGAYFAMYKEDDPTMSAATSALHAIGADAVVPPFLRANAAHDAYVDAEGSDESAEEYRRICTEAESEIYALDLDLRELLRDYIRREYPLRSDQ